mmetsp:Transcript_96530/g.170652  ORF Transcript_96530/g.170652 Transcript_96530/m.170652 type:complete len:116 (+) Transcript_96530:2-349(+)
MPGADKKMTVNVGDTVLFKWDGQWPHDLQEMTDSDALVNCTFSGSTQIHASTNKANVPVVMSAAGTKYYSCSVTGHCDANQKIIVEATLKATTNASTTSKVLISFLALAVQALWI